MIPDPATVCQSLQTAIQEQPTLLDTLQKAQQDVDAAQAQVRALKEHVSDQEDYVTSEALEGPDLSNAEKRKAAVTNALRIDQPLKNLKADLAAALSRLANAEGDLRDAERRLKGHQHSMTSWNAVADLAGRQMGMETERLKGQANKLYLEASRNQLEMQRARVAK